MPNHAVQRADRSCCPARPLVAQRYVKEYVDNADFEVHWNTVWLGT